MASQEDLMARKLGLSPLELNGASISEPVILSEQGKKPKSRDGLSVLEISDGN